MRIIAGKHKNRNLKTLEGLNTRPMMDRMKESIFNVIGPYFTDTVVLDLFGGSGALSLEAISRGASFSYIFDISKEAYKIINTNIQILKEEKNTIVYNITYQEGLKYLKSLNLKFDLVFLDPPYKLNIIENIINFLLKENMLNENALIVCQYLKDNFANSFKELETLKNYCYGTSEVNILRKI